MTDFHIQLTHLRELLEGQPPADLAVVAGSGLSGLVELGRPRCEIPYEAVPGMQPAGVSGHAGKLVVLETPATDGGAIVYALLGRKHLYEGIQPADAARWVRLLAGLGVGRVLLTNAAGSLRHGLDPGDLMLLDDHINLMLARNPLRGRIGEDVPDGPRFPDMSRPYDPAMRRELLEAARDARVPIREGVYVAVPGPSYESRAEVRMLRRLGADAVGMSTVPEVLAARQLGLTVAAVSLITNTHAGGAAPPTHEEVLAMARAGGNAMLRLIGNYLKRLEKRKAG